jgi:hypothetical protein
MATGGNRRGFRGLTRDVGLLLHVAHDEYRQVRRLQDYFATLGSSYPLLAECPRDLLETEARRLGIPVEGRSKLEIARAIFDAARRG